MEPDYDVYTEFNPGDDEDRCTVCRVMTGGTHCAICSAAICFGHSWLDTYGLVFCRDCYDGLLVAMNDDE